MAWLEEAIQENKKKIAKKIRPVCKDLAQHCARVWGDEKKLDHELERGLRKLPLCSHIYLVGMNGQQISPTHHRTSKNQEHSGKDLVDHPPFEDMNSLPDFSISQVYVNHITSNPAITALRAIYVNEVRTGFIAADFELKNLEISGKVQGESVDHMQIKGDPAIRASVFEQKKIMSAMDEHLDDVMIIMNEMILYHGVFHAKIHFSSSRATLWFVDDPFVYKIHVLNEIMDPAIILAYPRRPFPKRAVVKQEDIMKALDLCKQLRNADETIYLRSVTINIMNGMVGLTFSCDGSHYMSIENFIMRGMDFWFGVSF